MALKFANNNSLSAITSVPSGVGGGSLNLISTQTASSSSTISFTSGIDSTYKEYIFKFINIHPATNDATFQFQGETGTNTDYNETITSTAFRAVVGEDGDDSQLAYRNPNDQAQGTSFQTLAPNIGNQNDANVSGTLHIFDPSNTTFVKHFFSDINMSEGSDDGSGGTFCQRLFVAGYFNVTTALTRFQFKFSSGNIDAGTIKLYGVS
tara:strand:+ start:337 stop:960 length:624 start_codon:yes stop_codon:yes gene_type:complete